MKQTQQLLDYIVTQEDAIITYINSDMKIAVHSNSSYLSKPKARSRACGHLFLSNESTIPQNNGVILHIAHIIKHVMTSVTEAKPEALYIMAREAVYIRIIQEEMGHKQPPTPFTNRQRDGRLSMQLQDTTKTNKSNGNEHPLDQRQRMPKTI